MERTLGTALISKGLAYFMRKTNVEGRAEAGRRRETAGGDSVEDCARSNDRLSDDCLVYVMSVFDVQRVPRAPLGPVQRGPSETEARA